MENYLLMDHITKVYDNGVVANNAICLSAKKGEIHAICGENGAGKSTLMKILFGVEQPDSGRIVVKGEEVHIASPSTAISLGIGMVHQHFMLVPSLTVAENVVLGIEPMKGIRLDQRAAVKLTEEISDKYNLKVDPSARIADISVGVKQKVEIIKVLARGADILILDEPTAVLTPQETSELFEQLFHLKSIGYTILFISHKLKEVKALCDRATVIRQGKTIGIRDICDIDEAEISRMMVGADLSSSICKTPCQPQHVVLSVQNLTLQGDGNKPLLRDISFTIRAGEILGVVGVEGNGQQSLVNVITGLEEGSSGAITLNDESICGKSIRKRRDRGLTFVPEDRMTMGVAGELSIRENLISFLYRHPRYTGKILFNMKHIQEDTDRFVREYQIRCTSIEQPVGSLSGGNIQKVVVAREFACNPDLLICDQPTRGIDIGATNYIQNRLLEMREKGKAILLISASLSEIIDLSDRLVVLYNGELVAHFPNPKIISEEELGLYMLGVKRMAQQEIGGAVSNL